MKQIIRVLIICLAVIAAIWVSPAHSQDDTVLAINFDLSFTAGDQFYSVRSNASVRSGSEVPIELQKFKVGLRLVQSSSREFLLKLVVYEKSGVGWYQINTPAPEFHGEFGSPTEISWESADLLVEIALIVGIRDMDPSSNEIVANDYRIQKQ